ncbi:MAG: type II secretion system F family protein [Thermoanaerobaculia bacterium]|nr:type II secretion system F family protein [Thermoanaerobaculia bacterium]
MPNFVYKGRDASGALQEGVLAADSRDAAAAVLRKRNITVTNLRERERRIPLLPKIGGGVPSKKLSIFTRQFSVMLDAGLPLVQCLEILGGQEDHRIFKQIIDSVRTDVESGTSLADAMSRHPAAFDNLYVNMIAAGEAGGILDIILQRLSTYIEKTVKLKNQVKSALMYPIAVIVIAIGVVAIILIKVIPVFAQMFASMGAQLPWLTRQVVAASDLMQSYGGWMLFVLITVFVALQQYHKTYTGARVIDRFMLRIPVLGMLLRKIAIARFCRTLATLTASGVAILEGLEITAKTSGNSIIEDGIMKVRAAVEEGKTISGPLSETKVFPAMVCQMIGVGEQTGALDTMLSKIADFYEDEVDTAVNGLMKLLEPVMIVILGVIIGTIVIAMYLPMFTILQMI